MSGRRASDWLSPPPDSGPKAGGCERRGEERRAADRRAPMRKIDMGFCATLLGQMSAPATAPRRAQPYAARGHRPGLVADLKA